MHNISRISRPARRVLVLVFPGTRLLDVTGPMQVFKDAGHADGTPAYSVSMVSETGGNIVTDAGVPLPTIALDDVGEKPADTLLVTAGLPSVDTPPSPIMGSWLRHQANQVPRVASVCLGAFPLAHSGLLNHREAVTHWTYCNRLALDFPEIHVRLDPLYVRNERVWTSAGASAGIDMALAMVEEDLGRAEALRLSRMLVLYLNRPGGQAQFSAELRRQTDSRSGHFDELNRWIRSNPAGVHTVNSLADRAQMSPRNFARIYKADTGVSPAQAVEIFRVEAACILLEQGHLPLKRIASEVGFGAEVRMRRAFLKHRGISPAEYQDRFGQF